MPIKQMKKIEMLNNVKNIGLIILMTMLSISMIGLTIYLYWLADTKDMYIYNQEIRFLMFVEQDMIKIVYIHEKLLL